MTEKKKSGRGGARPNSGMKLGYKQTEVWRARIRAGVLLDRAMKMATDGKILDPQVENVRKAYADMLLKKVMPDLARTELTGDNGEPLRIITRAE